jgi:protein involved in polysaccharide export with SLBB domain/capsular polysaccharide biosynthesis protein
MRDELKSKPASVGSAGAEGATHVSGSQRREGPQPGPRKPGPDHEKAPNYWVLLDILAQRWHWLAVAGMLCAAGFFLMSWRYCQPKFTATAQLLRYQTPGTDFFKTDTPMSPETFSGLILSPELLKRVGEQAIPVVSADKLQKSIKVDDESDSDVVKVTLVARQPQVAVDLLNLYVNEVVKFTREMQANQAAQVATAYLRRQVEQMDQDIMALHKEFRGISVSPQVTNKLAEVGGQLNSLSQNLAGSARSSVMVGVQTEHLNKAMGELTELLSKYTEIHPLVRQKQSEIESLRAQVNQGSTNGSMSALAASLSATPTGQPFNPELDIIRTKLLSLEEGRVSLASRQREAELYAANPPGFARVWAFADMKNVQTNWRKVKVGLATIFGGCLGIGASFLLVLLVELADSRLKTPDDVKRVTKLPVLTALGDLQEMEPEARRQWAFRAWTMLQGRLSPSANHGLVCGITSSSHGEGRTTWINLLAEAASLTGFRVLTIATRPSPCAVGLPDSTPEEQQPESAGTTAFEGGSSSSLSPSVLSQPGDVTERLTGPDSQPVVHIPLPGWVWNLERRIQWGEALNHWRQIDNLVILVELPPASVAEAVLLGSNLPNIVWLTESGSAGAAETRQQLETLRDARCNLVGAVLNRLTALPVKSWFPRWVTCAVFLMALALGNAAAQNEGAPSNSTNMPEPAIPMTAPPVTPEHAAPPQPMAPLHTNLSFSIVRPSQRAGWQQHLTLGPGDILNFGLYGEPELTRQEVAIGPDGRVSYLEAQDIAATGLTIDELRSKLDQQLSQYRRAPRTLITPVAFRSKKYYMLGNVVMKGVYALDRPMTVLEAIARAHGLESGMINRSVVDLADFSHSFVAREGKRIPLNFESLFEAGDLSQNLAVEPGDYIYIASANADEVYVVGEVRLPGPVTYTPDMTVIAALAARGGFTDRAYKSHVLVVRGSLNHPDAYVVDVRGILAGNTVNFKLKPRDIIFVNSRPFIIAEELLDLAVSAFVQSLVVTTVDTKVLKPFNQ